MKFRKLRANEIECRIGMCRDNGLSLLLYKDARCDMNLLDETVGEFNWKREHRLIDGKLYCTVSVYCEARNEWVSKEDVGTESNTEKEKGQASDSFKRACFNWGIGRELYTAPFIWVTPDKANIKNNKCNDKFIVEEISYDDNGNIKDLVIKNVNTRVIAFSTKKQPTTGAKMNTNNVSNDKVYICEDCGTEVKTNVANFSKQKYGKVLCFNCQKQQKK